MADGRSTTSGAESEGAGRNPSAPEDAFRLQLDAGPGTIDANGHVNNVAWVQWMQEAAIAHYVALGGDAIDERQGASWFVRSHHVEYLRPAHRGDRIELLTWVENVRRVTSLRRYEFRDRGRSTLLVRGATDWVYVDRESGRPRRIPTAVHEALGGSR